jgi:hypothetical protein
MITIQFNRNWWKYFYPKVLNSVTREYYDIKIIRWLFFIWTEKPTELEVLKAIVEKQDEIINLCQPCLIRDQFEMKKLQEELTALKERIQE